MDNSEVTYYRFLSEIRYFLSQLISDPINAQPSKYLKGLKFGKERIINILLKKGIINRNEKITMPDEKNKKVKYNISYKIKREDFERKIKQIYDYYFDQNLPEKNENNMKIKECDCVNGLCGATSASVCNNTAPIQTLSKPLKKKPITLRITEEQFRYIMRKQGLDEATVTSLIGDYQYDAPCLAKKNDPAYIHNKKGGICCDRLK